jgi:hypothetical protein
MASKKKNKGKKKPTPQAEIHKELTTKMELTNEQAVEVEKLIAREQPADEPEEVLKPTVMATTEQKATVETKEETTAQVPPTAPSPAQTAQPAAAVQAPYASKITTRAGGAFSSIGGFAARALGIGPSITPEEKQVRGEILKINNQLILTKKIIESNGTNLRELAKTDKGVENLLKLLESNQFEQIEDIQAAILEGKEIGKKDAAALIASLRAVTLKLDESKVSLEAKFSDISGHFGSLIVNEDLNREDRRSMIKELVKIGNTGDIVAQLTEGQKSALKELEDLSATNINFTQDQNVALKKILTELSDSAIDKAKLRGTLSDLNETMDAAVLTNKDLEKKLKEKDDKGKTLEESALAGGIKGMAKTGISGLIDLALGQFGLGGLGLGEVVAGGAIPLAGKGIGMLGRAGGGLLKGVGGLFGLGGAGAAAGAAGVAGAGGAAAGGGLLKAGGKLLGKAALPLALAMAGYDAYKGFTNAEDIAGLGKGQKAGLGTKAQAAGASVLSGLTLGFVDPKTMYKGIEKGIDFLFGKEGIFGKSSSFLEKIMKLNPIGFILSAFDKITGGTGQLFGEGGIFMRAARFLGEGPAMMLKSLGDILGTPQEWEDKLASGFNQLSEMLFGDDGLLSANTAKRALRAASTTFLPDFMVNKFFGEETADVSVPPGDVDPQLARVPTKGADLAVRDAKREREMQEQQLSATQQGRNVTVVAPQQDAPKRPVDRSPGVDDMGLAVMNAGMSGL